MPKYDHDNVALLFKHTNIFRYVFDKTQHAGSISTFRHCFQFLKKYHICAEILEIIFRKYVEINKSYIPFSPINEGVIEEYLLQKVYQQPPPTTLFKLLELDTDTFNKIDQKLEYCSKHSKKLENFHSKNKALILLLGLIYLPLLLKNKRRVFSLNYKIRNDEQWSINHRLEKYRINNRYYHDRYDKKQRILEFAGINNISITVLVSFNNIRQLKKLKVGSISEEKTLSKYVEFMKCFKHLEDWLISRKLNKTFEKSFFFKIIENGNHPISRFNNYKQENGYIFTGCSFRATMLVDEGKLLVIISKNDINKAFDKMKK